MQHGAMGLCLFRSAALFLHPQGAPASATLNVRRRSGAKHKLVVEVGIVGLARLLLPSANCTAPARHPYVEFVGVGEISGSSVRLGICSSVLGTLQEWRDPYHV